MIPTSAHVQGLRFVGVLVEGGGLGQQGATTVDPAVVINSNQARPFLAAVGNQGPRGERLKACFGRMYYAALRPGGGN